MKFAVKTDSGFKDMDQKLELVVAGDTTVGHLKQTIQAQMAGHPPTRLQRLFYEGRRLKDEERLNEVLREDAIVPLPIVLDMAPPLPQLDYEGMLQLKVRYESLDFKQPLFYAANAVGLKYALAALDDHLLHKPPLEEDEEEEEEDNEEEDDIENELAKTRTMKDEILSLKEYLKQHEREVAPPPPIQPDPNPVSAIIRELGVPGLEGLVKTLAVQLNLDWGRTCRYAFAAYLFGKFGT